MQFKLNFYALLPFLTLLQALIFSSLLIYRGATKERRSDYWLALVLMLSAISDVPYMLGWMGINYLWTTLTFYPWDGWDFALPPALYFFFLHLTNQNYRFRKRDWFHFLPYAIYFTYHLIVAIQGQAYAEWWWRNIDDQWHIYRFFQVVKVVQQTGYFYLTLKLYRSYRAWIEQQFSDIERVSFKWFVNALYVFASFVVATWLYSITDLLNHYDYETMWWVYLFDTVFVYYLSIAGYNQPLITSLYFRDTSQMPAPQTFDAPETEMPKSVLVDTELTEWKSKIAAFMDNDSPYLQSGLTLSEMATRLHTNNTLLSSVINDGFGKNFNDFVNEYRVELFKKRIEDGAFRHLTLLAVAYECGFNSKATFNRAFKKLVGKAPKEFIDETINNKTII